MMYDEVVNAAPVLRYGDLKRMDLFKFAAGMDALFMRGEFGWVNLNTGAQVSAEDPATPVIKWRLVEPMKVAADVCAKAGAV